MLDLTLVSCNYNTPAQIEALLKSWKFHNSEVSRKCIIMEHSTDDESVPFLESNKIPYIRNRGSVHYKGVEAAFQLVNTRYMLLVDSDVVFNKPIGDVLSNYIGSAINLAGRVEGDRGGFLLHRRVHPWFCFIDLEFVNNNSIRFVDMVRIRNTKSEGFYKNIPHNEFHQIRKYDVGSTFLEDVMKFGGRVLNHNIEDEYFTHFEGMSWRKNTDNKSWLEAANEADKRFLIESAKYSKVDLKGFFDDR
jgi:hypothetical protein